MKARLADWIKRYGPAEIAGTVTAVAGSFLSHALTGNEIVAAYGGAIGENLGFYGVSEFSRRICNSSKSSLLPRGFFV